MMVNSLVLDNGLTLRSRCLADKLAFIVSTDKRLGPASSSVGNVPNLSEAVAEPAAMVAAKLVQKAIDLTIFFMVRPFFDINQ